MIAAMEVGDGMSEEGGELAVECPEDRVPDDDSVELLDRRALGWGDGDTSGRVEPKLVVLAFLGNVGEVVTVATKALST